MKEQDILIVILLICLLWHKIRLNNIKYRELKEKYIQDETDTSII